MGVVFAALTVAGYIIWELVGEAPQGMVTLVGIAGGALYGAVSSDKSKRNAEVSDTAQRAEAKADRALDEQHGGHDDAPDADDPRGVRP